MPVVDEQDEQEGRRAKAERDEPYLPDVTETVTITEHMTPSELRDVMKKISNLARHLVIRILLNNAAPGGLSNPCVQQMCNCAVTADTAAAMLEGPPKIMPPHRFPTAGRA